MTSEILTTSTFWPEVNPMLSNSEITHTHTRAHTHRVLMKSGLILGHLATEISGETFFKTGAVSRKIQL